MAALSLGNVFFWLEAGYFDAASETKPLLHKWSLSVEEQFYLIWPATLILLTMLGRTMTLVGLVILCIISVTAALAYLPYDPSAVFYLTPFRIHQFGIGAIIALVGWLPANRFSSVVAFAAVTGIIILSNFVDGTSPYLLSAILPAVFAGLVLLTSRSAFSNSVLASLPAVWIGKRSYSLYLAHWPIIVLWKMKTDLEFSASEQIIAVIVAMAAGVLLYELVETRFRFRQSHSSARKGRALFVSVGLGVSALALGAHSWGYQGFPNRFSPEILVASGDFESRWSRRQAAVREGICSHPATEADASDYEVERCSSPPETGRAYLVVGDRFANDSLLVLQAAYPDIYFGQIAVPGCLLRLPQQFGSNEQVECRKLYTLALSELIQDRRYDGIVMSANWQDGHYYRINDLINSLAQRNLDIVIVGQRLRFKDRLPTIVASSSDLNRRREKPGHLCEAKSSKSTRSSTSGSHSA